MTALVKTMRQLQETVPMWLRPRRTVFSVSHGGNLHLCGGAGRNARFTFTLLILYPYETDSSSKLRFAFLNVKTNSKQTEAALITADRMLVVAALHLITH